MNESWNVSVDNSSRTKTSWSVKNCSLRKQSTNWQSTAARARNSKRWRKWRPATLATNPGHTAFMFFPALETRRHGNRGYADFKVRGTWPWLLCEEWKTHDSTWAIPQKLTSTRAIRQDSWAFLKTHEQSLKSHEQNSSWKMLMRISKSSWALMRTHEDSWVPHEDSWVPHEVLMRKKFLATFFCKGC